jgi:hypothetical protein
MKEWRVSTEFGPEKLYLLLLDIESKGQVVFTVTEGRTDSGRVRYTVVAFKEVPA